MASQTTTVLAQDGRKGTLHWYEPTDEGQVVVKFDGRAFTIPNYLLKSGDNGDYTLELTAKDLLAGKYGSYSEDEYVQSEQGSAELTGSERHVIPEIQEQLKVSKHNLTEHVTLTKTINETEERVRLPLEHSEIDMQLIEVGKPIDSPPEIRIEGDTTIIPIVVEKLIVKKQLFLKAEMHVTKQQKSRVYEETHTLREENISVERSTETSDEEVVDSDHTSI